MKTLIENLEREGGHILILFCLVLVGLIVMVMFNNERFLDATLGALLFCMKGNSQTRNNLSPNPNAQIGDKSNEKVP